MQHPEPKPVFTPRVLISHCLRAASSVCDVRCDMILSSARNASIVLARQIGMAVAYDLTGQGMPAIGRGFGGKDHTTVLGAINKVRAMAAADPHVARIVRAVTAKARDLAGIHTDVSLSEPERPAPEAPRVVRAAALIALDDKPAPPAVTAEQRREMRHLRAKGWSPKGLMKRYGLPSEEAVYAELGEQSPKKLAA
jgi:hypothetical protein